MEYCWHLSKYWEYNFTVGNGYAIDACALTVKAMKLSDWTLMQQMLGNHGTLSMKRELQLGPYCNTWQRPSILRIRRWANKTTWICVKVYHPKVMAGNESLGPKQRQLQLDLVWLIIRLSPFRYNRFKNTMQNTSRIMTLHLITIQWLSGIWYNSQQIISLIIVSVFCSTELHWAELILTTL